METEKRETEYKKLRNWEEEAERLEEYDFKVVADSVYEKVKETSGKNIKNALDYAIYFQNHAQAAILYGINDYASKYMELGYVYSQIAIEKNSRIEVGELLGPNDARYCQYKARYSLEWYKTDIESSEYEEKILEYVVKVEDEIKGKRFKQGANLNAIRECTHIGAFELAKEQLAVYYTRKKNQEINADIIYTPRIFYDYILEYLSDEENHKDMYSKLETVFMTFFNELDKNNWTLRLAYGSDENRSEIYYIWYKYFMKVDKKELTAKNVYQSLRYGLFFWRKDKTQ